MIIFAFILVPYVTASVSVAVSIFDNIKNMTYNYFFLFFINKDNKLQVFIQKNGETPNMII